MRHRVLKLFGRIRRQVDEEKEEDDFGTILTRFLTADAETQQVIFFSLNANAPSDHFWHVVIGIGRWGFLYFIS